MTSADIKLELQEIQTRVQGILGSAKAAIKRLEAIGVALDTPAVAAAAPLDPDPGDAVRTCQKKNRYTSSEAAGRAAGYAKSRGSMDDLRIYPCDVCGGFHLTKMGLNDFVDVSK